MQEILKNPRYELVPMRGLKEQAACLPQGATIALTCSPATEQMKPIYKENALPSRNRAEKILPIREKYALGATIRATERLVKMGFNVIPHVPARWIINKRDLAEVVARIRESGAREIFIPAGDLDQPAGDFCRTLELLMVLRRDYAGVFERIGIAAHPQGHPFLDSGLLLEHFKQKQELADYAVTQICCNPKQLIKWLEFIRKEQSCSLPIYIGVMGYIERKKLLKIGKRFGRKQSLWFLRKNPQLLRAIARGHYSPEEIMTALTDELCGKYNIAGVHFNTFAPAYGGISQTRAWLEAPA